MEKTLNISEQNLHSTLNEFLEEKEKKPKKGIWNITSITGLLLVFFSASYVGHAIATEVFSLSSFPIIYTIMKMTPYIGGAMLGLILISMFIKPKEQKELEVIEEEKAKEAYDKLDEFLYKNKKKTSKSYKKSSGFASDHSSFRVSAVQKLMRSRTDKKIMGVCGGLAKYLGMNSTLIRILFVLAIFLGYGSFIIVYIAMGFIMPKEPIEFMDDFK